MSLQLELLLVAAIFFVVATLYASVGFGGGSSYLAILTLFFSNFTEIRTTALLCNLIVVTGSCWLYYKHQHLQFKKFLPFVITSVPMAFLGAIFKLEEAVFFSLLGIALILFMALIIQNKKRTKNSNEPINYPSQLSYFLGEVLVFYRIGRYWWRNFLSTNFTSFKVG